MTRLFSYCRAGLAGLAALMILCGACSRISMDSSPTLALSQPADTPQRLTETPFQPLATETQNSPTLTLTSEPSSTAAPGAQIAVAQMPSVDVWDDPAHEGDYWSLQTQLIMGERVLVQELRGEWARVIAVQQPSSKDADGYPGWVRTNQLAQGWGNEPTGLVVMAARANVYETPSTGSAALTKVYFSTRLPLEEEQPGWVRVSLPDGRSGWLQNEDMRLGKEDDPFQEEIIFTAAPALYGLPYKWGGASGTALDCSGLIYRLASAAGMIVPRDAGDMAREGREIPLAGRQPGDLLFCSKTTGGAVSHVVMIWELDSILDASPENGVKVRPLNDLLPSCASPMLRRVFRQE